MSVSLGNARLTAWRRKTHLYLPALRALIPLLPHLIRLNIFDQCVVRVHHRSNLSCPFVALVANSPSVSILTRHPLTSAHRAPAVPTVSPAGAGCCSLTRSPRIANTVQPALSNFISLIRCYDVIQFLPSSFTLFRKSVFFVYTTKNLE